MNYEDFYLDRQLKKESKGSPAIDLIKGLDSRRIQQNAKNTESLQLYAEQEFIRKTNYAEMVSIYFNF